MESLWRPSQERMQQSRMASFMRTANGGACHDWQSLYRWSIKSPLAFWKEVWTFCNVVADISKPEWCACPVDLSCVTPPGNSPQWFSGARLNYAENLLRYRDDHTALISWTEEGRQGSMSYAELYSEVARVARGLSELDVKPGDHVAGVMPNVPETIVAMLATASLGATWTSCSPDFGAPAIMDRLGQTQPKVLFGVISGKKP